MVNVGSPLIGQTAGRLDLHARYGANLIAISRQGEHLTARLGETTLRGGDVIVLQGRFDALPGELRDLGCLRLAQRALRLERSNRSWLPIAILAVAMSATAMAWAPVAVAFFAAAGLIVALGALPVREAYGHVEWRIVVIPGALIPAADTLVMGSGGYRFGDYARLGAPLSLLVLVAGTPLILAVWPLH